MSSASPSSSQASDGLRERKKAKTRAAIQDHALRLFRERGYAATTVEQIAEAAEISPSTFFRYFPCKENVVFKDEFDPMIIESFLAQPPELTAIQAFRSAVRAVVAPLSADELNAARERHTLVWETPELRAAALARVGVSMRMIAGLAARRAGRAPDDFAVRTFAGAVFGILMAASDKWASTPQSDMFADIDEALGLLEAGLPL
jgi:AcrR family transcriptional regulator